jgi:hypothetical protein
MVGVAVLVRVEVTVKVRVGTAVPVVVAVAVRVIVAVTVIVGVAVGVAVLGGVTVPETVRVAVAAEFELVALFEGDVGSILPQSQAKGMAAKAISKSKKMDRLMGPAFQGCLLFRPIKMRSSCWPSSSLLDFFNQVSRALLLIIKRVLYSIKSFSG